MMAEISQIIYESTSSRPIILNKKGLVERLRKKQTLFAKNSLPPNIIKVLEAQTMFRPKREIVSNTLADLDAEHALEELSHALGINSIRVGRKIAYHAEAQTLVLGAEGALGAAMMQKVLPAQTEAAGQTIMAILREQTLPANTTAQELGAAMLMLHMMQNGVDGLFFDLSLDRQFVQWLHTHNGAGLVLTAKFEMQTMQLELWKWVEKDPKNEREATH